MVTKHMIHGPCGHVNSYAPCIDQKRAQKIFSKAFCKIFTHSTIIPEDCLLSKELVDITSRCGLDDYN